MLFSVVSLCLQFMPFRGSVSEDRKNFKLGWIVDQSLSCRGRFESSSLASFLAT